MYNIKESPYRGSKRKRFLPFALFIYWVVLVLWQNMGDYTAKSSADVVLKTCLLIWLIFWYIFWIPTARFSYKGVLLFIIFLFSQLITFCFETGSGLSVLVTYIFPSLFLFFSLVYGNGYKIDTAQYIIFLHCVIIVAAYSALYALIFKTEQFLSAFSISSAYGNELTSFFVSNHEYGMYMIGGIISCILCLELRRKEIFLKKITYVLCLILFIPNLILTFSRTSMLAMVIFLFLYFSFAGKVKGRWIFVISVMAIVIAWLSIEPARKFIYEIILKENNMAGRDDLYALAIRYFKEGTIWQRLFGRGISAPRAYFEMMLDHGSVHNGYLQVLLYYGIIGLGFMVYFLIHRFISVIKIIRKDRFVGVVCLGLVVVCISLMFTNTSIIFNSPIDSFFLTMFTIIVPKYLGNGTKNK